MTPLKRVLLVKLSSRHTGITLASRKNVRLDMLSQRNNTAHICDGNAAKALAQEIIDRFILAFEALEKSACERYADRLDAL